MAFVSRRRLDDGRVGRIQSDTSHCRVYAPGNWGHFLATIPDCMERTNTPKGLNGRGRERVQHSQNQLYQGIHEKFVRQLGAR